MYNNVNLNQRAGGVKIFCVIPAFNEEKNLPAVLEAVKPIVSQTVVVNDGSTDNTLAVALGARVTVLSHLINRGQGAALKTGTEFALAAGADIIVHFDADGQFLASQIMAVAAPIIKGEAEVVFGSRFLNSDRSSLNMPAQKKYLIMPLARLFNRLFLKVELTDPQSGFRALSRHAAETIDWRQDGMAHCSEILFAAANARLKIREVPITVIYRHFGQRLSGGFRIVKDLLIARLIN